MSLDTLTQSAAPRHRSHAWLLPLLLVPGFAGLFALLLKDELLPPPAVQTVRAQLADTEMAAAATAEPKAKLLFRATGWLGADPFPYKATAFVGGQVAELAVTEGQQVKKGDLIARIDEAEYRLARDAARAAQAQAEANARAADERVAAEEEYERAALQREENDRIRSERYNALPDSAMSPQQKSDALHDMTISRARSAEAAARLRAARAEAAAAASAVQAARTAAERAELDLSRCAIVAPIDGRILEVKALPGGRLNPKGESADMSTAATLYDPQKLALAADVPLDRAGGLYVGQRARITCDALPNTVFTGKVARLYGRADETRNTLRAQVSLDAPDDRLRPDMQCRASFYSEGELPADDNEPTAADGDTDGGDVVLLPAEALQGNTVWVVNPQNRLERKTVSREPAADRSGLLGVRGVLAGQPAVLSPAADLQEGGRVSPEPQHNTAP